MRSRCYARELKQLIHQGLVRLAIALFLMSGFSAAARAQVPALVGAAKFADSAAREINRGTIEGDINLLHAARTVLDAALALHPNDPMLLHYRGFEAFREAGLMYSLNRPSQIAVLMREAATDLAKSDSIKSMPENHALLASVLGSMIGADASLGPTLGPDVQDHMNAAMSSGATNPRVWLLSGISTIYTPPEYGGGLSKAQTQLERAVELFNTDHPLPPAPSWGHAEAYAWLGQVLQKQGKSADAIAAYNRALVLEPKYSLVKYVWLPSVKR
ncbi:MAG: tetratricopeptide repeat protein [Gemmatimonadaceae bacterium]